MQVRVGFYIFNNTFNMINIQLIIDKISIVYKHNLLLYYNILYYIPAYLLNINI